MTSRWCPFRVIRIRLPHYALGQRWDLEHYCENQSIAVDQRDCRIVDREKHA